MYELPRKRECPLLPHLTRFSAPNGRLPGAKSEEQNKKTYHTSLCLLQFFWCVHIIVQIQGQIWPDFARTMLENIFGDLFLFDALPEKIETNPPGTVRDSSISTERWWSAAGNQCAAVMKLNPGYQLILEMFNRMFALSIGVCVNKYR